MRAVTSGTSGLRTARRISHVFVMDVPTYAETLFITDAAINISPDLDVKRDIVQNAIDLYNQVGFDTPPRVALLSAVETVTSKIPSTIEAAALCKMADRGQITGGVLDGPLAFDNAIDPEAAKIKGITSAVAGRAQILVVPDLEAGNMLAKNLTFLAKADAAGIVLGARVPIILTSRADSVRSRMASCAVAVIYADARRRVRGCRLAGGVALYGYDLGRQCGPRASSFRCLALEPSGDPKRRIRGQVDGIGSRPRCARAMRAATAWLTAPLPKPKSRLFRMPCRRRHLAARGLQHQPDRGRAPGGMAVRDSIDRTLIDHQVLDHLARYSSRRRCISRIIWRRSAPC